MNNYSSLVRVQFPQAIPIEGAIGLRLLALWNSHVDADWGIEPRHLANGGPRLFDDMSLTYGETYAQIEAWDRYSIDGTHDFALAVSRAYPDSTVLFHEEWTGEGPFITRERWRDGQLVASRDSAGPLLPSISGLPLPEAFTALQEALTAFGELLGNVWVGDGFWEQWQGMEGRALATVFERAGLPQHADLIRERIGEADPETVPDLRPRES